MSVHDGHRQRLRGRFLAEGLDGFHQVQVLEMLLFYTIPRKDTNPIAHRLIDRFGSLSQVLEAPVEELMKEPGITENTAAFLHMITEVGRYYLVNRLTQTTVLKSLESCASYMLPYFFGRTVETVFLLCLDSKCKVLCCKEVASGSVNSTSLSIRNVVSTALSANASAVMLAHNHPGGLAIPSDDDVLTTRRVWEALKAVEIELVDHIVVVENDYVSLLQSRLMLYAQSPAQEVSYE